MTVMYFSARSVSKDSVTTRISDGQLRLASLLVMQHINERSSALRCYPYAENQTEIKSPIQQ